MDDAEREPKRATREDPKRLAEWWCRRLANGGGLTMEQVLRSLLRRVPNVTEEFARATIAVALSLEWLTPLEVVYQTPSNLPVPGYTPDPEAETRYYVGAKFWTRTPEAMKTYVGESLRAGLGGIVKR